MVRVNAKIEAKKTASLADAPPLDAGAVAKPDDTDLEPPTDQNPPAADPRENSPDYWRQRFNVTQGMLRAAQEQLREGNGEKDRLITELRDKVRTLEAGSASENDKADVAMFFTPEQIERFGQDQCEAMATAAVTAARQQAQALLEAEVKPLQDRAKATQAQAKEAKETAFWEKLAELMPDWAEVNETQTFLDWLADTDENSGLQRQRILDQHRLALNAPGVAKLFRDFKKASARPTPPVAAARGPSGGQNEGNANNTPALGYPSKTETKEYYKRAALGKVSDKERAEFEARLKSKAAA